MRLLFALTLLLPAQVALAASAADLYRDGRFAEAAIAGRQEATAASLVISGKSTLTIAGFEVTDKARARAMIDQADHDFDAALAKAPNSIDAQLQKATAIGYKAKLTKSPGLAKDTRERFEAVIARDPNNALAWASMAGWHAGAVSTLGRFVAGAVLGATSKVAFADFETAMAKDPRSPVHPAFYALTLLDLGTENAPRATELLRLASRLQGRDAYENLLRRGATQVLVPLMADDLKGAQTLARRLLPFGKLS
ncbi:MAG: hypothetical protein ACRYG4_17120 [Janthinobacterium lividum]